MMRPQFMRTGHTPFTKNSVKMLQNSDEYQRYQAIADQGARFRTMGIVSMVIFFVMLYADFMTALVRHSGFVGAAMAAAPPVTHVAFLLVAFYTAAWMNTGSWSATYDSRAAVANVFLAHLAASATIALVPWKELELAPFVTRATLVHPWPALVPFAATFPAGLVLFFWRYSGFWKRKGLSSSPYLRTAPLIMVVTLAVWWYLALIVAQRHQTLDRAAQHVNRKIADYARGAAESFKATPGAALKHVAADASTLIAANARHLYGALLTHTAALAIWTVLLGTVIPSVGEAVASLLWSLMPSGRTVWLVAVVATIAEGAYLHWRGTPFPSYEMSALGCLLTGLLVRGFPAENSGDE